MSIATLSALLMTLLNHNSGKIKTQPSLLFGMVQEAMGSIRLCNQKIAELELGQCVCNLSTLACVFGRWLHGLFALSYTPGSMDKSV